MRCALAVAVVATLAPAPALAGPASTPVEWALDNDGSVTGYPDADVDATEARAFGTGAGVVVAVLDTGVDATHPELAGRIYVNAVEAAGTVGVDDDSNGLVDDVNGWDLACDAPLATDGVAACHGPNPNGTQVAGLIASADNGALTTGLAPDATILPLKVFHLDPAQNAANLETWATAAVNYAVTAGVDVLQLGWSIDPAVFPQSLYDALAAAESAGVVIVAAAGSAGRDLDVDPVYPAAFDLTGLVAVAGSTSTDAIAAFPGVYDTDLGATTVDILAPGENLAAIWQGNPAEVIAHRGPSAASALVSGAAAVVLSIDGSLSPDEVVQILLDTVDPISAAQGRVVSGGRLNVASAAATASAGGEPPTVETQFGSSALGGVTGLYTAAGTTDSDGDLSTFTWNFGDGVARTGETTVHAFTTAGTWPVAVEVVDAAGHRRTHREIVRVPFRWHELPLALDATDCPDAGGEKACDWALSAPAGAVWVRAHFTQLEVTEPNRSWTFFDSADTAQFSLQTLPTDGWTEPLPGNLARARFQGVVGGGAGAQMDRIAFALPGESNHPPVARVDGSRAVSIGATAVLDASGSSDPEDDPIATTWQLLERPAGSSSDITVSADGSEAALTPDIAGVYTLELEVRDAELADRALAYVVTIEDDPGGCDCALVPTRPRPRPFWLALLIGSALFLLRFRRAHRAPRPRAGGASAVVLVAVAASMLAGCGAHRHAPHDPTTAMEHFTVETADGWALGITHLPSDNVVHPNPVLLVHGMASNRHSWDAVPGGSLAAYLAERGWDVWMLDLRGHGDSERPSWPGKKHDWTFDAYARHDVPAAIDFVLEKTGQTGVFYVGHSMGGMVGHQYLGTERGTGVAGFVPIASPVGFEDTERLFRRGSKFKPRNLRGHAVGRFAFLTGYQPPGFLKWFIWNPRNVSKSERKAVVRWAGDDVYDGELRQGQKWTETGALCSADGKTNYLANISRIRVPVFLIAGSADLVVPPERVLAALPHLNTDDLTVRVFGRANGYRYDYGHVDLILGRRAASEVFPAIHAWMASRSPPPAPASTPEPSQP